MHKADAVAVIVGSQWYYLKQSEPNTKVWQGIAFTGRDSAVTAEVKSDGSRDTTVHPRPQII